jgi:large subunit ribosomal protein L9
VQVILNQDVEKIGQRGDIVDVSRGYVRNFLVPRGLAEVATSAKLEEARRSMEESGSETGVWPRGPRRSPASSTRA